MDNGSGLGDQYCKIQSRLQLFIDSGGGVIQVCLGGTRQDQDWTRRDDRL